MTFTIITADQRAAQKRGIKGVIFGPSGIGKTSLLWTLNAKKTLFIDLEAGDLSVDGCAVDTLMPRTWEECRDLACFIGGANPALPQNMPYSKAHYDYAVAKFGGDAKALDKYDTIFVDSITVAGRLSFNWSKQQPQSFSEKTGKPDTRSAYGLHGQEMISWLTQLQHSQSKNVWLVGILDTKTDDFNRKIFVPQIEGGKTGLELPGIVDQVISMVEMRDAEGGNPYRAFVCHTLNPMGYPAKDRSGRLDMIEEPHLGKLMEKISGPKKPTTMTYDISKKETNDE